MSVPGLGERYPVYPRDGWQRRHCIAIRERSAMTQRLNSRVEVDVRSRISRRVDFKHQQINNPSETFTHFEPFLNREIFDASTGLPLPRIISLHLNVTTQNTRTSVFNTTKQPNLITSIHKHKIILRCAHGGPNRHSGRCRSEQLRRNG